MVTIAQEGYMDKTDNLVVFPKPKRAIPANAIPDVTHYYRGPVRRNSQFLPWNMVLNILIFLADCLRTIVLTILLFFRPVVFLVCRPVAGLALIACIIAFATDAHDERLKYGFGIFSFCAFLTMHLYDGLLMSLSRGNIVNILN
jgi:hypothetical protein